ncbi:MAG TPA: GGDEF domain-containing protein [Acidimicrobiales bacterium]|nr:GGDEF domain-containing protein [Acidimicrobiales bacterium]
MDVTLTESGYEPWLFQAMLNELSVSELGIGFIYTLLERLAERHELSDVVVVLSHESFGVQTFRLGGQSVSPEMAGRLGHEPGVHCVPDVVSDIERDAVRTACQLALSLHLARFSAGHDPLTNISNRRSFDAALQIAAARSARYGWAFTLVMIDLNDFKAVNDRAGHDFGDYLLRQFGFALRRSVRNGDTAARFGGDEFAVILSNAEGNEAAGFTERLRTHLKAAGDIIDFTIGTATSPRDSTNAAELLRLADARLYEKKGRHHE